ncbi:RadC family protein [Gluconacetobacter azotocaptans]|uniref:RadC family protein n=2 Tax=Gluconacetobacter azotocaptans TaxID=142834 RepID=A0A7W4JTZ6_9PROT|nr:RadC family protein [Gluconacetobacter azotocaptans]GBQ31583.1 DNA repair protein RadC [Gluconacetobacter azotocaptans DSM 13594]
MARQGGKGAATPSRNAPFKDTGPQGHRARMRARVLTAGAHALADYEIVEMLLFPGIPRRDTKPMAKALINRFGSLAALLSASSDDLRGAGLSDGVALPLMLPACAATRLSRPEPVTRAHVGDWDAVMTYCDTVLADAPPGQLRILFLDSGNHVIADDTVSATLDGGELDALQRHILLRALDVHATAFVGVRIAASWPPSAAQIDRDTVLMQAISHHAQALSLTVQDHLLLGRGRWISLRQERRL